MSFYKINFEQLRQDPQISEMLSALERGLERFGIDFYLVGALARDDIKDISDILKHFFSMYDNEIWENHNDLFETENANLLHIAAMVMAR